MNDPRLVPVAGFTLFEMLVVLAIAALIGTLAFPAVERARGAMAFTDALGRVEAALNSARARALRTGEPASFTLDTVTGSFGGGERLPDGVRGEGAANVRFFPDGSASTARFALIWRTARAQIAVDPVSGLVTVER